MASEKCSQCAPAVAVEAALMYSHLHLCNVLAQLQGLGSRHFSLHVGSTWLTHKPWCWADGDLVAVASNCNMAVMLRSVHTFWISWTASHQTTQQLTAASKHRGASWH